MSGRTLISTLLSGESHSILHVVVPAMESWSVLRMFTPLAAVFGRERTSHDVNGSSSRQLKHFLCIHDNCLSSHIVSLTSAQFQHLLYVLSSADFMATTLFSYPVEFCLSTQQTNRTALCFLCFKLALRHRGCVPQTSFLKLTASLNWLV